MILNESLSSLLAEAAPVAVVVEVVVAVAVEPLIILEICYECSWRKEAVSPQCRGACIAVLLI